jgi:type I restriction enzyme, R subunit
MNALIDKAVERFKDFQDSVEEESDLWRGKVKSFQNLYAFLSQVIPYQDSDLEKLYTYLKHLALKLPKRKLELGYQFDEEIQLAYYRLQKISEGSISLQEGYASPLDGPKDVGSGRVREENVPLSRLIDLINDRFGEELNEADQLFFDQITEAASLVDSITQAAQTNPMEKFQLVFGQVLESLFIERMEINEDLFARYMNDPDFKEVVSQWLGQQVYSRIPKDITY